MLVGGTTNTIVQIVAHAHFRGRVISHYTQSFLGMIPWGALLLGALAHSLGVTEAISIGGAVVIAVRSWPMRTGGPAASSSSTRRPNERHLRRHRERASARSGV